MLGHELGHYYSPIPSFTYLEERAAVIWAQDPPTEIAGIDLNPGGQLALVDELSPYHDDHPFTTDPQPGLRYHFNNRMYSTADGIVLYSMLRHLRPPRVIEVGSGYSSALMLDTLATGVALTFIDPEPQRLQSLLRPEDKERATIFPQPIQDVDASIFSALEAGDVLFIDSSHVTKTGSDANLIVFDILPALAPGVYVHFHDAFYPFEYPKSYLDARWAWNELYLLRAFLQYNANFEIALWPGYLEALHRQALAERMPLALTPSAIWPDIRGASLWLRKVGR